MTHNAESDAGLQRRYRVEKINDPTGKHDDCYYFVLDPRHDLIALQALKFYSRLARQAGRFDLADNLDQWTHDETERLSEPSVVPPGPGCSCGCHTNTDEGVRYSHMIGCCDQPNTRVFPPGKDQS